MNGNGKQKRRWVVVQGWDKFQHYKDRRPPWIKNHTDLLNRDEYLDLSGHRRSILHGLWLEYASSDCRLRVDTVSLSRRLQLRITTADLEALNRAGFIRFSASAPLAPRKQSAMPETETEEETKKETPQPPFGETEEKACPLGCGHTADTEYELNRHTELEHNMVLSVARWKANQKLRAIEGGAA